MRTAIALGTLAFVLIAALPASAQSYGWRGNWTGLYPNADPPTEWTRVSRGVAAQLTVQAAKPAGDARGGAALDKGFIREWLVVGPLEVGDTVNEFDKEQIADETKLAPAEGDKAVPSNGATAQGELAWKKIEIPKEADYMRWGTTEIEKLDIDKTFGKDPNRVIYAFAWVYSDRAGKAAFLVDHHFGFKLWVNGEVAYSNPKNAAGLGSYVGISKQKRGLSHSRSPKAVITLKAGWNRLLAKATTYNQKGWWGFGFASRIVDVDPVPYEEKNITWVAPMPERTNGAPLVIGDRIVTTADPDVVLCVDRKTGKILWKRLNTWFHTIPQAEVQANAALRDTVAPLVAELEKADNPAAAPASAEAGEDTSLDLRRKIRDELAKVDKARFDPKWDGHFESHFGIIGLSTNPVSDGKNVYVFFGHGLAACYDLDGNRKWAKQIVPSQLGYTCSPAVSGDVFVVFQEKLIAYKKETGEIAWEQPEIKGSIASLIAGRIRGVDVVVSQLGDVVRASDGKVLCPKLGQAGAWTSPLLLDDVLYVPGGALLMADFSEVDPKADAWKPRSRSVGVERIHKRPDNGQWLDRGNCGSPLIADGFYYECDIYGVFYAVDLTTGKTVVRRDLGFDELHSYNHVGVAPSPALGGKHIYVMDNQGECVVLDPGPECKEIARNRLAAITHRDWPMPPQEVTNSSIVFDGKQVFIRAEENLYCIGR